jgi:hypothetical protein
MSSTDMILQQVDISNTTLNLDGPTPAVTEALQRSFDPVGTLQHAHAYFTNIHSAFRYALLTSTHLGFTDESLGIQPPSSEAVYCPKCPAVFRRDHDLRRHLVYVFFTSS